MTDQALARAAVQAVREHGSIIAAAKATGIPRHTLSNRLAQAVVAGIAEPAAGGDIALARVKAEVRELRAKLGKAHATTIEAEDVRATILGLAKEPASPPAWLVGKRNRTGTTGVPVTMWADWHIGETVNPAEVNYVNEFNLAVAEKRIRRLVERTIDLAKGHMTNPDYPGIVVALMGDMVTGEIHDELAQTNDLDLLPSVLWTRDRLIWALERMADEFGRVFVPAVSGNHGRNTKRLQAKRFAAKNFDWLIYCLLERYFKERGDNRVVIHAPEVNEVRFDVYGHRFLALHGHDLGVKGGDGIIGALGPIMRGQMKVSTSQAQIGRDFDTLLIGHWHQELWLSRVICANTLKGYDEFARAFLRAGFSLPSQPLFFVHPRHGITARWDVLLEDREYHGPRPWAAWEAKA